MVDCLELEKMFDYVCEGEVIVVIKLDCLGCFVVDLVNILKLFDDKGVGFIVID